MCSVFVLHDGMDEDAPHADDYYKMKIRSFHQDGDRVLALGHWFYSAEELGDLKLGSRFVIASLCFAYRYLTLRQRQGPPPQAGVYGNG